MSFFFPERMFPSFFPEIPVSFLSSFFQDLPPSTPPPPPPPGRVKKKTHGRVRRPRRVPQVLRRVERFKSQSRQKVPRVHKPRHGPHLPSRRLLQDLRDVAQLRDCRARKTEGRQRPQKLGTGRQRVERLNSREDLGPNSGLLLGVKDVRWGRAWNVGPGELGEAGAAELVVLVVEALETSFFF